tara:strand:- start:3172 stop:3360 length:189 start_codon:yes stop_codon:yes gene_type:complete
MKEFKPSPKVISWLEDTIKNTDDKADKESYQKSLDNIKACTIKGRLGYLAACYSYNLEHPYT